MFRHRLADCCEYRENKRKLALKRLQRNRERRTDKRKNDDGCEENDEEIEDEKRKCEKNKSNRTIIPPKYYSYIDAMLDRIKPTIKDREKYTADSRHVRCFLEVAEIEQLKREERFLRVYGRDFCDSAQDKRAIKLKNKGRNSPSTQSLSTNINEKENKNELEDVAGHPETSHDEKNKNKEKSRGVKDAFWCPEVKIENKKKQSRKIRESDIYCKDSICSFDSQIDLSGLALTNEEKKTIRDNRRNKEPASPTQ